jgi:hypothetical protein
MMLSNMIFHKLTNRWRHRKRKEVTVQYEPTGFILYFKYISIINLYMFREGLLLSITRYYPVYTYIAIGICHAENNGIV